MSPRVPRFVLITPTHRGEAPFLEAFCRHYQRLGISRILFTVVDQGTADWLCRLLPLKEMEECRFVVLPRNINASPPLASSLLTDAERSGSIICRFDCDEFLELPAGVSSLTELWMRSPFEYLQVPWLLVSADSDQGRTTGFWGAGARQGKYMVRGSLISRLRVHAPDLTSPDGVCPAELPDLHLLHYWGRDLDDTVMKLLLRSDLPDNIKNRAVGPQLAMGQLEDLPARLKIHAYFCLRHRPLQTPDHLDGQINEHLRKALFDEISDGCDMQHKLHLAYALYKKQLVECGLLDDSELYPGRAQRIIDIVQKGHLPAMRQWGNFQS